MKSRAVVLVCLAVVLATGSIAGAARADAPHWFVEPIELVAVVDGRPADIEVIFALGDAIDGDPFEVLAEGLGTDQFGGSSETRAYLWGQFMDRSGKNDSLIQSYSPAGEPTPAALAALRSAQSSWNAVGDTFGFDFGGIAARCPSLAADCGAARHADGHNDLGWVSLDWDRPESGIVVLGYTTTVYDDSTGAAIESDTVLNSEIGPMAWSTDGGHPDVETMLLHALGITAGLPLAGEGVMGGFLAGTMRTPTDDDTALLRRVYPSRPLVLTDHALPAGVQLVAEQGKPAPGGGVFLPHGFELGDTNARGDVAFVANVEEGQGLFVAGHDGAREVARSGQTLAGIPLGMGSHGVVAIRDSGEVAVPWILGDALGPETRAALFRVDARGKALAVVRPDLTPAPGGGTFLRVADAAFSARGDIVFWGFVEGDPRESGIFVARESGQIDLIARTGDPAPGGGTFTSFAGGPSISSNGHIAFAATTSVGEGRGVYASEVAGGLRAVARPGDPAPGGSTFVDARAPGINARADVVFAGMVAPRPSVGTRFGVYLARDGVVAPVATRGDVLSDGRRFSAVIAFANGISLNDRGELAFVAFADFTLAVYRYAHGRVEPVLAEGTVLFGYGWIIDLVPTFFSVQVDDRGGVVFQAGTTIGRYALLRAGPKT